MLAMQSISFLHAGLMTGDAADAVATNVRGKVFRVERLPCRGAVRHREDKMQDGCGGRCRAALPAFAASLLVSVSCGSMTVKWGGHFAMHQVPDQLDPNGS